MFKVSLNRKNKKQFCRITNQDLNIPEKWYDFASSCKIRSGQGIVNFIPYPYQTQLVDAVEAHRTTVIAKTRQLGITETISNYFLWKALRIPGYLAVIFSKCQSDTSNIAKRLRRQIESLNISTKSDSVTDIELINGGRILFRNSTPNGARGLESVSDILFDEASFIDDIEEIYKSAIPCTTVVGSRAKIIILSTPNGQSGWYWDKLTENNGDKDVLTICEQIKNKNILPIQQFTDSVGTCKFFIHWLAHPVFSRINNYLESIENQFGLSRDVVEQEYNLSFTSSQTLVFSPSLVYRQAVAERCKQPEKNYYYMGLDTASVGSDYTVLSVLKWQNEKAVLVDWYRKNQESSQINILKIVEMIEKYNPISIGVETNGIGQIYLEQLQLIVNHQFEEIRVTQETKAALITRILLALEKEKLEYPKNCPLVAELLSFQRDGKKYEAISGKHDDFVMSLAFGLSITPFKPFSGDSIINFSQFHT